MNKTYTSLATIVATLAVRPGEDLPEWYTIFPAGEHEVEGQGKYLVNKAAWKLVQAGIARRGIDLVFDYEHQTLKDVKAPAAGWCIDWRWTDGVGIEARINWTDEAAEYLKKGEYRYYSPVFQVRQSDRLLVAVHSVALTNAPRTNHLKPLLAKLGAEHKEEEMDLLKMLIAALKLPEGSTEQEVLDAVAKCNQAPKEKEVIAKAVVEALGIAESDVSTVVASIHALKQEGKNSVSRAEFDALQKKLTEKDATEAVVAAMKAGKVTPDQKDWATKYAEADPAGFATFVTKAPVVVPVRDLPKDDIHGVPALGDETVLKVAKMMGVGADDLKTFGGLQ